MGQSNWLIGEIKSWTWEALHWKCKVQKQKQEDKPETSWGRARLYAFSLHALGPHPVGTETRFKKNLDPVLVPTSLRNWTLDPIKKNQVNWGVDSTPSSKIGLQTQFWFLLNSEIWAWFGYIGTFHVPETIGSYLVIWVPTQHWYKHIWYEIQPITPQYHPFQWCQHTSKLQSLPKTPIWTMIRGIPQGVWFKPCTMKWVSGI
jgi:hypothetical protein